jgi:hypothetical protein
VCSLRGASRGCKINLQDSVEVDSDSGEKGMEKLRFVINLFDIVLFRRLARLDGLKLKGEGQPLYITLGPKF